MRSSIALFAVIVSAASAAPAVGVSANAARTLQLSENAALHLTSHKGFTLNEQGVATGTIAGAIYIHLHITSTNHVTAEVNIYPHGSSITGSAAASYRASGAVARFNGTMSVTRGTGRYAHAHATGLTFSGQIRRTDDAVTVHVAGRLSY